VTTPTTTPGSTTSDDIVQRLRDWIHAQADANMISWPRVLEAAIAECESATAQWDGIYEAAEFLIGGTSFYGAEPLAFAWDTWRQLGHLLQTAAVEICDADHDGHPAKAISYATLHELLERAESMATAARELEVEALSGYRVGSAEATR